MSNRLKIVVADDEEVICAMLTKIIDFDGLNLELVGMAHDGETLMGIIERERPDIVVTDISMPKMDGLKVVANVQQRGLKIKFIIISGYTQFEYAYNALKYDVKDYLLKPIDKDELNLAIKKTVNELNASGELDNYVDTLHSFFIKNIVMQPNDIPKSIASINSVYSLNIRDAAMRVVLLRIDLPNAGRLAEDNVTSVINKFIDLFYKHMGPICHEVAFNTNELSAIAFINYDSSAEQRVRDEIDTLFVEIKNVVGIFAMMVPTICIGDPTNDINELHKSYLQAKHTLWVRRALGVGRIIYYDERDNETPEEIERKLTGLKKDYNKALSSLDSNNMLKVIDELFSMPETALRKEAVRLFAIQCIQLIGDKIKELRPEIPDADEIEDIYRSLKTEMGLCVTYNSLRNTIKRCIRDIIFRINKSLENKPFNPIKIAYKYVDQNFGKQISLNDVAGAVSLSPAYFSVLFKKETGVSLMEYITDVRINKAKEYLRTTNMNVNEIAYALSFQDARYFSKLFKKKVGIKPTEYRKIYG